MKSSTATTAAVSQTDLSHWQAMLADKATLLARPGMAVTGFVLSGIEYVDGCAELHGITLDELRV